LPVAAVVEVVAVVDVDVEVDVDAWVGDVVAELVLVVGVAWVFVEVDVELVVPVLFALPLPDVVAGTVHHLVVKLDVVLPEVCVPVIVTGGVTVVGFELVAVFDELWVLDVPPLMAGSTLIVGWMSIAGATITVWSER
jgi:hypothetical protein